MHRVCGGINKKRMNHAEEINFAWYLSFWVCELKLEESAFWRTMNPRRCITLYREYLKKYKKAFAPQEPQSLAAYFMGG